MAKKRKLGLTEKHFIGLTEAASARATVSVYGKIVRDAALQADGRDAPLQR